MQIKNTSFKTKQLKTTEESKPRYKNPSKAQLNSASEYILLWLSNTLYKNI